jgi:hypothetical protein
VLLGGDHHQRPAVELPGRLGAVDELPEPLKRGLGVPVVAVVDAQAAAGPVLAGLGDVGASSSITSRTPPAAMRAIRSPVCVYGELSWSAPRRA